jgi:hypothetical protein
MHFLPIFWIGEVARLVAVDHLLVAVEHEHEALLHLRRAAALGHDALAAGDLGGLAEHQRVAGLVELVEGVADRRVRAAARGGVALPALGRHPELVDGAGLALLLARHLHELAGGAAGAQDGVVVAVALDAEADDRLAGGRDAVDHLLGPAVLDADDDDRRHVGIAARADQRAEVELEVGAELQPAVGMGNRERALDVVRDSFGGGVGQVVQRQDDDVVAHADAAVFAAIAEEGGVFGNDGHGGISFRFVSGERRCAYQRLVLMFWT